MAFFFQIRSAFMSEYSEIFANFGPMGNKEIAAQFSLIASLMELHGENSFKTKTYLNAYQSLRKWDRPLSEMSQADIATIPGVGASAASRITELITNGKLDVLEKLKEKTPLGIQQLLSIKGMGPKKIRVIWDSLGIETPAELLYACNENRLVKLPGFGLKTQEDLSAKISYFLDSMHRYLYGVIENDISKFEANWQTTFPESPLRWTGDYARKSPVISALECIISPSIEVEKLDKLADVELVEQTGEDKFSILVAGRYTIRCIMSSKEQAIGQWVVSTIPKPLLEKLEPALKNFKGNAVEELLASAGFSGLPEEMLDYDGIENATKELWKNLITEQDIKGIVHNHSTYSDGINTLEEMAVRVRESGYSYFGICDHSQSAFYANGLSPERVVEQWEEIDRLNKKLAPFVILKGIESDILNDGSLDYEEEMLAQFDLVVASVHSNLRMDESKATARLIKAIENPYTNILGHPTSRLLLARPGYPVNHKKIIDACASNGVAIELNANPQRMDIDYTWIHYCQEKEVWISVNPDAHSRSQLGYMKYGIITARKGGLKVENCLNALGLNEFMEVIGRK